MFSAVLSFTKYFFVCFLLSIHFHFIYCILSVSCKVLDEGRRAERVFTSFCLARRLGGQVPPTGPWVPQNSFKSSNVSILSSCDSIKMGIQQFGPRSKNRSQDKQKEETFSFLDGLWNCKAGRFFAILWPWSGSSELPEKVFLPWAYRMGKNYFFPVLNRLSPGKALYAIVHYTLGRDLSLEWTKPGFKPHGRSHTWW